MKSFVFHFGRGLRLPAGSRHKFSFKEYFLKNGIKIILLILFLFGLVSGALYSVSADKQLLDRLDLVFVTNIESRIAMSATEIFISCFLSDFIIALAVFLFAFCAWGSIAIPFVTVFKGFSVGVSSAVIFSLYRSSGIGFYIIVILPCAVMFLMTLIYLSKEAFSMSLRFFRTCFSGSCSPPVSEHIKNFLIKSVIAFLLTSASALADTMLWVMFARLFEFTH